jgi:hypothetical protein
MSTFSIRFTFLFALVCVLISIGSAPALARPSSEAITPEAFWQRVEQTLATLRELQTRPDETVAPALDALADEWAQLDALTLPDGKSTPFDPSFIVAKLRQRPYDLDSLITLFADLQKSQGIDPSRSFGSGDLNALQTILKRPEFQWNQVPSPLEEWWNELWARINQWINELLGGGDVSIPIPGEVVTITASILLLLVLLYIFRSLFADFITEASIDEEQLAGDELLTAETALQKAKDISRAGDHRTAVRYLYLSALLTLDERGLLRFDRAKTNREYLRSVAAFPQLSAPLRDVIEVFDRVWYGFQPLDDDGFQHYIQKVDQLREQKK